jgi:NTE family protein
MDKKDFLKLVDPNKPQKSLFKGEKAKKFLSDSFFGKKTFQDTRIPLVICATDSTEKEPAYLTEGEIIDAVMASVSIPGIFPPYKIGKKVYVDGGVLDPVPTKPLLDRGLDRVIGVNLTGYRSGKRIKKDDNLIPSLMNAFYMMMEQMAKKEDDPRLFMLNPRFKPGASNMLALYEWEENHRIGEEEIDSKISALKKWLNS